MFDIGFSEIIFILVITLLVVGPERLPRIARTVGLWTGKVRGFVASVKADIDRELATEELRKALEKQASVPEIEELIDEVTGEALQAAERIAPAAEQEATQEAPRVTEDNTETAVDDRDK